MRSEPHTVGYYGGGEGVRQNEFIPKTYYVLVKISTENPLFHWKLLTISMILSAAGAITSFLYGC